jgi:serine phosphatase RsbU (regulator of sigma subunit)
VERSEHQVTLGRGATVLLYTDGLVERRDQSVDDGVARLDALLTECGELPIDELCDRVLDRLVPLQREDDVALTVVRLHRQDVPRPPSAGPKRVPPAVPPE